MGRSSSFSQLTSAIDFAGHRPQPCRRCQRVRRGPSHAAAAAESFDNAVVRERLADERFQSRHRGAMVGAGSAGVNECTAPGSEAWRPRQN